MNHTQLLYNYLDQRKYPIWIIDFNYQLIYANRAYQDFIKEVTGEYRKLNESIFVESGNEVDIKKWEEYYIRAFKGEHFEIEEHFFDQESNETHYRLITFEPLIGEDGEVFAASCQSKDISHTIHQEPDVKQLIDSSLDVFCTVDQQGCFTYVSAASEEHWGYSPEELIGTPFKKLLFKEDIPKTMKVFEEIMKGNDIKSFVNRYNTKNGGVSYNLWSSRWEESSGLIYGVVRDYKDLIEKENERKLREERFKNLVQGAFDLIGVVDVNGYYTYMSPSCLKITGFPPEAFVGTNAFEFVHQDDIDQVRADFQKSLSESRVNMQLYRAKNLKNEWRWVETTLSNMLDEPSVCGVIVNSRDVTDRIEEKNRLKLLESVITHTKDAVLITEAEELDAPGPKILYVNDAFTKMTGYEAEKIIGKSPRILQGPNSNQEELTKLGVALRNGESYELTTINYKKSGEEFWINFTVSPVTNEKGQYTHMIAIERDVTEQKNIEIEKNLINSISYIFQESASNDLTTCLSNLCEHVVKFGDFNMAELWLPSIDADRINQVVNYSKDKVGSEFYQATKQITSSAFGEGLPGYIWKNKKTEVWGNVEGKWIPERKLAAKKAGIESIIGVPLTHNGELIGVLLLGSLKTKSTLDKDIVLLKKLESVIGGELSRKKTEIELTQIFDYSPDLICMADFDGYIKRMNPSGLEMLGYTLDEIRSRPIISFLHEDDRLLTRENQMKLYEGEDLQNFENRYIASDGKVVWLSWTSTSFPAEGVVYAVAKNITEEKKLRELNREVGQLAKIGSWEYDVLNDTLFWSDEVHKIYGTDSSSFQPSIDAAINFYREDYRELARSSFEKCIETHEPYTIEAVIVNSKNKEVWVRTSAKAEFVDGACTRVYGSFQDVDDTKQAEIRLQSFSENLPGVVYQYIIHPDGTDSMQFISGMVERLWGYTTNQVMQNIDLLWDQIKEGGDIKEVKSSIAKSIETKSKWTCRFKIINRTGEIKTHLGSGTPIFLADGTILFYVMVLDITHEVKNEELLNEVTNMARVGSWELDLINQDGDSIYWSPILREIVEVDDSYNPTLTGGIEFHVGESKERIQKALDLLIHEGIEFDEEILLLTAKGNERWNRCIGKSEMVNGKRARIYGSYQDIHKRKKSELEVLKAKELAEENEQKMKEAQKLAHIGSWYYDVVNQVSQWSEETYNIWGLNKDITSVDLIDHQKLIHPKDWDRFNSVINNAIEKGIPYKMDLELVRPDGSFKTVNTIGEPIFDENNQVIAFKGTTQDISDRIIIENELRSAIEKAEKSLKSLEDFKFALDQSAIIAFTDNKGVITSVNDNFCKISKFEREEVIGKTHRIINSKHHPKKFFKDLWKTIQSGEIWRGEIKNKAKDNSFYWVDTTIVPFLDENNKPIQYLAIRFDVTERKRAEESLNVTTERLRIATSSGNIGIWDWDVLNDNLIWDETMYKIFGVEENEFQGAYEAFEARLHPDDLDDTNEKVQSALKGLSKFNTEFRIIRKDKSIRYLTGEAVLVYEDTTGKPTRLIGTNIDITERKKAEKENRFKANLLGTIGQATIATNLDGIVTYWNKAAEHIYGWKREEALGKNIIYLTPIEDNKIEAQNIMDALKKGQTWSGQFKVKRKDGTVFLAMISNSPIYNEKNILSGMIGISSDISEKVKNEQLLSQYTLELERSNEELEQFAFVASHDLQEPLRMVSSFMDLLKKKYEDQLDEKAQQYIYLATDGAKRMKQIILDLLDYSRATKHNEGLEEVNINEILTEFMQLRSQLISEKSAQITANGLPTLFSYKAAITQIIHCLIDNALKYSADDTPPIIDINAAEEEKEWKLSIKDNGIGIEPQFFDKIFVIFQRLHNKNKYSGTGIGLSIAKRHVEFIGGQISLESKLGEGTTFYFTIPKIKKT